MGNEVEMKEEDKPWYLYRSSWSGVLMVVIAIIAGVLGRIDPLEAGAFAVAGLSVIFLRSSVSVVIGVAFEVLREIRKSPGYRGGSNLLIVMLVGSILSVSGCCRDLKPTLDRVSVFLERVKGDYQGSEVKFSDDPEWDAKFREARVRAIDAHIELLEEAKK